MSRPRFWMYLVGPYVVGLLAGARSPHDLLDWRAPCFFVFFLFPANLFVYGVNDAHDFETDALNSKKELYEVRSERRAQRSLLRASAWAVAPFVLLALLVTGSRAVALLVLFLLLSHAYSAPPVRAKARPFLDSLFNVLYACPAFFAHAMLGGQGLDWHLDWRLLGAAWCWCGAMHAYSAAPDITADSRAGVRTIATALGLKPTLMLCALLYSLAALASHSTLGLLSPLLGAVYVGAMALSIRLASARGEDGVMQAYRFFPALNTLAGFLLFWRVAWIKFEPEILASLRPWLSSH